MMSTVTPDSSYVFDELRRREEELHILERQAALALPLEKAIWQEHGLRSDMAVLDMGCGHGMTSRFLAEYAVHGRVTGVDPSQELIAAARSIQAKQPLPNLEFRSGNVYEPSLPEASFDFIYCRLLFQHLSEPETALNRLQRLLRPGGIVCLVDVDDGWLTLYPEPPELAALVERSQRAQRNAGGDREVGRKLAVLLNQTGFANVREQVKTLSSSDLGLETFLQVALAFRVEQLSVAETDPALREYDAVRTAARQNRAWGALGLFVASGHRAG